MIIVPMMVGMPTLLLLVKMALGYRERQAARQAFPAQASAAIEARLERLEHAIDSVAIELERLGEGQRFTTKLLAERSALVPDAPRRSERSVTPH